MFKPDRRAFSLSALAMLAACASPERQPRFKTYYGPPVTQVAVHKGQRSMYLLSGANVMKSYRFGLGFQPTGHKQFEGDGKTPEGLYYVDRFNPRSRYHLSVGISYPNETDRAFAEAMGRDPGRDIMIHGRGPEGNKLVRKNWDWTAGCMTVSDEEIEDIYSMLTPGLPVMIYA